MVDKLKITCRPIVVLDKEEEKEDAIGYCYYVETYHGKDQEIIWWELFSDGTYKRYGTYYYSNGYSTYEEEKGSFDKSKYQDFVNQIQSFKDNWLSELRCEKEIGWSNN